MIFLLITHFSVLLAVKLPNICLIVHHVHYFYLFVSHIYISFIFPILGALYFRLGPQNLGPSGRHTVELPIPFSLYIIYIPVIFPFHMYTLFSSFLSWGPYIFYPGSLHFRLGAHDLGTQWQICCFIFPFHTHILLIFPILGPLNFLSRVPLNFSLGLTKSQADPSGRLAVELTISVSLYITYIIFILRFHIYIIFIFPILGPLISYLWAPKFSFGSPKISGPSGRFAVKLPIPFSLYIMYIILFFPFHRYTIFSSFLSWSP